MTFTAPALGAPTRAAGLSGAGWHEPRSPNATASVSGRRAHWPTDAVTSPHARATRVDQGRSCVLQIPTHAVVVHLDAVQRNVDRQSCEAPDASAQHHDTVALLLANLAAACRALNHLVLRGLVFAAHDTNMDTASMDVKSFGKDSDLRGPQRVLDLGGASHVQPTIRQIIRCSAGSHRERRTSRTCRVGSAPTDASTSNCINPNIFQSAFKKDASGRKSGVFRSTSVKSSVTRGTP